MDIFTLGDDDFEVFPPPFLFLSLLETLDLLFPSVARIRIEGDRDSGIVVSVVLLLLLSRRGFWVR